MEGNLLPSLRQLRTFAAVARLESISRASAELHLSQSAVTQAIATLEARLDVPLFVRRSKGTYLTELGRIIERRTRRFFEIIEDAVGELSDRLDQAQAASLAGVAQRITKSQLCALIAIYESGSFFQAAQRIGVSQTSVHRSARSLEAQLPGTIFHNTAIGVTTNDRGARFAERLLSATREIEWALEEVDAERGIVRGRILIGTLALAGNYFLASKLSHFVSIYPLAKVMVVNGPYDGLLRRLRAGSLDFLVGLLKNPAPVDDVIEEELLRDPYVVAVRNTHPLALKTSVAPADLAGFDWILASPGASRRVAFDNTFPGLHGPHPDVETHSLPTITAMLAETDRMAILTQSELRVARQQGQPLQALPTPSIEPSSAIGVTTRKDWRPTRLQRCFLEFLRGQTMQLAAE